MNRVPGSVALLLALVASTASGQGAPWGAPPGGGSPWYQQQQPGYPGGYPSGYPGGGANPWSHPQQSPGTWGRESTRPAAAPREPTLEVTLEAHRAFVHQNLVVTLEVISDGNLKSVSTETPRSEAALFRQLGDPTAEARTRDGRREIVNRLFYQLTPLRPGAIELHPIRVTGTHADGRSFEAVAEHPIEIEALPPDPSVRPWLPLRELELSARLVDDEAMGEGRPLTLIVEQRAVGMTGAQLPSPEAQLASERHRLYRESTEQEAEISTEGQLVGKRIDRFTIVPQQGGRLEIPAVEVEWWNVDKGRKERSIIPARGLEVAGSLPDEGQQGEGEGTDETTGGGPSSIVWIVLVAIAFAAGLAWRPLWSKGGLWGEWLARRVAEATAPARRRLAEEWLRFFSRRHLHRARRHFADALPRSLRLRFCVRAADDEEEPEAWAQVLRFLLERRLGLCAQHPMGRLAEALITIHPGARPETVRALLSELEGALYGDTPIDDFKRWKRAFNREISPHPLAWLRLTLRRRGRPRLPALNPDTFA